MLLTYICHAVERPCVNQRELDLIGDDGTRTELCADLVCPDRIKVYETESLDVTVALDVLEVAQRSHITLIGVVLPIKLEEVQLASAHARHALADCGLDGGARDVAVFEYTPLGAAEDGAWWELLLKLAKDDLCWTIVIGHIKRSVALINVACHGFAYP